MLTCAQFLGMQILFPLLEVSQHSVFTTTTNAPTRNTYTSPSPTLLQFSLSLSLSLFLELNVACPCEGRKGTYSTPSSGTPANHLASQPPLPQTLKLGRGMSWALPDSMPQFLPPGKQGEQGSGS